MNDWNGHFQVDEGYKWTCLIASPDISGCSTCSSIEYDYPYECVKVASHITITECFNGGMDTNPLNGSVIEMFTSVSTVHSAAVYRRLRHGRRLRWTWDWKTTIDSALLSHQQTLMSNVNKNVLEVKGILYRNEFSEFLLLMFGRREFQRAGPALE